MQNSETITCETFSIETLKDVCGNASATQGNNVHYVSRSGMIACNMCNPRVFYTWLLSGAYISCAMDKGNVIINTPLIWQKIVECSMLSNKSIELQKSVPRSINPISTIISAE